MYINNFNKLKDNKNYTFFPVAESACGRLINSDNQEKINFGSCDYLGLANDHRLKEAAINAIKDFGTNISGAMLMSGYTKLHKNFENKLSELYPGYFALMFTTSFLANIGGISSIIGQDDIAILDKLSHSCLIEGAKISKATMRIYKHNDMENLEKILKSYPDKRKLVITDGVFSADGDIANIKDIAYLCQKYGAISYVDDAHGVGILGKNGCGSVEIFNSLGKIDFISGTMSKAFGSTGGFLLMKDQELYNSMRHLCSYYTSSRAVSPAVVAASLASLEIYNTEGLERREKTLGFSKLMTSLLNSKGFNTLNTETPIIPIVFGDVQLTGAIAKSMNDRGFLTPHFPPPYVEINKSRLRIGVSYFHTKEDIYNFVDNLEEVYQNVRNSCYNYID